MLLIYHDAFYERERERERVLAPSKKLYFKPRSIFVCLLFVVGFFISANSASAATYTVCSSGCTVTTVAAAMALDLNPDDIVELQADTLGGSKTYSRMLLTIDDAGSTGHPLVIRGRVGDNITIDGGGGTGAFRIANLGNDYITVKNLSFINGVTAIIYLSKDTTGLTFDGVTASGSTYVFYSDQNTTGLTIKNSSFSDGASVSIRLNSPGMIHASTTISDVTITGGTTGVYLDNAVNPDITNVSVNGGTTGFRFGNLSGVVSLSDLSAHDSQSGGNIYGLYILNSALTDALIENSSFYNNATYGVYIYNSSGLTLNNINAYGNASSGFKIDGGSYNLLFNDNKAYNNLEDGFSSSGTEHDITYYQCESYLNGSAGIATSGDGFTGHQGDYNILIKNSLSHDNKNTGYAYTGTTHGWIYNSSAYGNGDTDHNTRGGLWLYDTGVSATTSLGWTVKNNIVAESINVPLMIYPFDKTLLDGGQLVMDNNLYYNSSDPFGSNMASVDGGSSKISWTDYHFSYEVNSKYLNPYFISPSNFALQPLSPAIDSGTTGSWITSTSTDYAGNPIYGTPDIGAYEYQPPFTIGTDDLDVTGDIRIYGDGKYRYTTATSSTMSANFSVAPPEGTWTYSASTTRPEWLNISNITWNTSGTYSKQWTASSTSATTTVYTIGDLQPDTSYTIAVDGVTSSTQTSNGSGVITYTYDGGYSTHTFSVTKVPDPEPTPTTNHSSSGSSAQSRVNNLRAVGNYALADQIAKQYGIDIPPEQLIQIVPTNQNISSTFTRDLELGMSGDDVKELQRFLNNKGFTIAVSGPGSLGNETSLFGLLTQQALIKFQASLNITPAIGYFGPLTRAFVNGTQASSTTSISTTTSPFTRNLAYGSTGEDVRQLQVFLNTHGHTVATAGLGSLGDETTMFGQATQSALIKFQIAQAITPAVGFFGPVTRKAVEGMR